MSGAMVRGKFKIEIYYSNERIEYDDQDNQTEKQKQGEENEKENLFYGAACLLFID